jgi:Flp pilus assembly protein TadD
MEIIKEYVIYVVGLLNLSILGFIIRFSLIMKNAFNEKEDILKKRIEDMYTELTKTEKWASREKEELKKEKKVLQKQLDEILKKAEVDPLSFDLPMAVKKLNSEVKSSLKEISTKIEKLKIKDNSDNYNLNISMAKAYASNEDWYKAGKQYDIATFKVKDNWELYFHKGIAYANSRKGSYAVKQALQAYSDAIVYMPNEIPNNTKARLFLYKGAILKRLNRLDEAQIDIELGLKYATAPYEINDGLYNLACVYAMKNDINNFNQVSDTLKNNDISTYNFLLQRLKEYAPNFKK